MLRNLLALLVSLPACAQTYDLLLKGGHLIEPASQTDAVRDIAITAGRVARVAASIPTAEAKRTIDLTGLYVAPGLIDLHAHVFGYSGTIFPDDTSLIAGATTVVDAGGSGWRTFDEFRARIIAKSRTRVLALINIVGAGMVGPRAESNVEDMDPKSTAQKIAQNRDVIVGIKTAHFGRPGWAALDRAVEAGRIADVPVMVDLGILSGSGRNTRDKVLDHMRAGDIATHLYNDRQLELIDRFTGKVQPYMIEARRRGVFFDMGHGAGSFLWPVATAATRQGFWPDSISTDLHSSSIMMQESDMPNCISKMMLLGMPLTDAIARSTVAPAKEIHRFPELGTLAEGRPADIAVFELRSGVFAFKDSWSKKRLGKQKLECVLTIRDGNIVFSRDGMGFPLYADAPESH